MSPSDIAELRHTIGSLQRCVGLLRTHYGDVAAVRRIANDVDRLDLDAGDLEATPPSEMGVGSHDIIYVPDSKSDEAAWIGAQDEGLGFHSRPRTA